MQGNSSINIFIFSDAQPTKWQCSTPAHLGILTTSLIQAYERETEVISYPKRAVNFQRVFEQVTFFAREFPKERIAKEITPPLNATCRTIDLVFVLNIFLREDHANIYPI